jgi:DNA repair protein RadD
VPALSLIDQTVDRLVENGIPLDNIGVIQQQHRLADPTAPIQVCSVQTLERRKMPYTDFAIIDEVHRWHRCYEGWLKGLWKDISVIGLSATPWSKGLGRYFSKLIVGATTRQLIDAKRLSDFRVFAPSSPDLKGLKVIAGDYHEGELSQRMNTPTLVADVVDTWLQRGQNRSTILFAVDRAHAKHLQEKFQAAGVTAAYIDAYTDRIERNRIRDQLHAGIIRIVCSVGTLTTGVDWDVRCIIWARPTRSEILFVQGTGRGLRTATGKDHCLILDHSDNHTRLGFVTEIHHDELDDGTRATKAKPDNTEKLPKACPSCAFLKPAKCLECPNC